MFSSKIRSPLALVVRSAALKRSGRQLLHRHVTLPFANKCSFLPVRPMSTHTITSTESETEHDFDEVENNAILQSEQDRLASYNGVQVLNSSGVRAVELCRPDTGNYLTTSVTKTLIKKIEDFEKNWVANAIFLGSKSLFLFSGGVHTTDFLQQQQEGVDGEGRQLDTAIQVCASRVLDFPKHMISLYGGFITGTPFGMLLGSHYRLGTPSLLLCLTEPTRGQVPLGALALGFARYTTIAPVVLKYLAVSGATIHSNDLYEMGVLTHLTDHKPHTGLQYGDTILLTETQAVQGPHGEPAFLDDMIDDMDINVDMEDIHAHESWDKFLTVPVAVPASDPVEDTNIQLIYEEMQGCFSLGLTLEQTLDMLLEKQQQQPECAWVQQALRNVSKASPLALKCWYKLVDRSQTLAATYKSMLADTESYSAEDCAHFYKRTHADLLALEVTINDVSATSHHRAVCCVLSAAMMLNETPWLMCD